MILVIDKKFFTKHRLAFFVVEMLLIPFRATVKHLLDFDQYLDTVVTYDTYQAMIVTYDASFKIMCICRLRFCYVLILDISFVKSWFFSFLCRITQYVL